MTYFPTGPCVIIVSAATTWKGVTAKANLPVHDWQEYL